MWARTLVLALALWSTPAVAAPLHLSHQGRLLDAGGGPLVGAHTLTFKLYDAETGGTAFWSEAHPLQLDDGYFEVTLGDLSAIDVDDFAGHAEVWLGMTVDTGAEMPTRVRVVSVPYALRAEQADGVAAGTRIDASEVAIDGLTVIDADGRISFDSLKDVPADALAALTCSTGQIARYDGTAWRCAAQDDHTHEAGDIASGTLAFARLPVGTTSSTVAVGDHGHPDLLSRSGGTMTGNLAGTTASFTGAVTVGGALSGAAATFTGAVSTASISGGSAAFSGSVTAGSVSSGTGTFTGAVSVGPLTGSSATFTGAVGTGALTATTGAFSGGVSAASLSAGNGTFTGTVDADTVTAADALLDTVDVTTLTAGDGFFDGQIDADAVAASTVSAGAVDVSGALTAGSAVFGGSVAVGPTGAGCGESNAGTLRYVAAGHVLEICDSDAWQVVFERIQGQTQADPGVTCKQIKDAFPRAGDGAYWIKPTSYGGAAFKVYCDMTTLGGGWTLVGKTSGLAYNADGGVLDGADTARWINKQYLGDITDLDNEDALGPAYESVPFTDFMFVGLHDTSKKLAWRHTTTFGSLFSVFSSATVQTSTSLLLGDFRTLDWRPGCTVGSGPDATGPQFYGFNVRSDSDVTGGTLVSGYTGGWCAALAGWGRSNGTASYSGGGLGAICQGRSHQMGRHLWNHGDGCAPSDWTGGSYNSFYGHAFLVR